MATHARTTKDDRDKTRLRAGIKHRKRLHVLRNPAKLAFRGWEAVPDPWSFDDCANYIEWCHIDKAFPEERHNSHRRFNKANLKYCIDEAFKNRCIEVYQVLYDLSNVKRNEVNLFIARAAHAEVKLHKRVDYSTLKNVRENVKVPTPANGLIPMGVRKYPQGGLGKFKPMIEPVDRYETEASSTDSDSDGSHVQIAITRQAQQRAKRRRVEQERNEGMNDVIGEVQLPENDEPPVEVSVGVADADTIQNLKNQLDERNAELRSLYEEFGKLREEVKDKNIVIDKQQRDNEDLRAALQAATMTNKGHDGQDEEQGPTPDGGAAVDKSQELTDMLAKNARLQSKLDAMVEQYYQWKLACVFSVDRTRQLVAEIKKIDNNYSEHNQERVFGLTSWALVDDHFPTDGLATIDTIGGQTIVDWSQHNWDFKREVSSTLDHQGKPMLLWPHPSSFVSDGTMCPICLNPFGPEGGMHLGTCEHLYHPFCLISLMIVRRRCSLCKAPFHERLYELFGLVPYMPPHWELNETNAPEHATMWGKDLVWSWKLKVHSLSKAQLSTEMGWEREPDQIVKVCHNLIPSNDKFSEGRRCFFYQCFNGHWDEVGQKFQFGPHPRQWLWNVDGVRITDDNGAIIVNNADQPDPRALLQLSESEWREVFKNDGVDFLLDEHSPGTRRALDDLMQSQILRAVLEEDGPARRTRSAARRLRLGSDEDLPVEVGTHDDEAGPSGTTDTPMNIG